MFITLPKYFFKLLILLINWNNKKFVIFIRWFRDKISPNLDLVNFKFFIGIVISKLLSNSVINYLFNFSLASKINNARLSLSF